MERKGSMNTCVERHKGSQWWSVEAGQRDRFSAAGYLYESRKRFLLLEGDFWQQEPFKI